MSNPRALVVSSQNMGARGDDPLGWSEADPLQTCPFTRGLLIMPNWFDRCSSNGTSIRRRFGRITGTFASRLSRTFNVIGTDTDRLGTYDILLTFYSNHCTVSKIERDIGQKLRIFSPNPAEGLGLRIGQHRMGLRNYNDELPGRKESSLISLAVSIHYTNVTAWRIWQTDRHRPMRTAHMHSVAR